MESGEAVGRQEGRRTPLWGADALHEGTSSEAGAGKLQEFGKGVKWIVTGYGLQPGPKTGQIQSRLYSSPNSNFCTNAVGSRKTSELEIRTTRIPK